MLLGVVVLAACYGAGVLYFYSSAAKWEGAELKESEQEHALQSKLQVLETERNVQKQTACGLAPGPCAPHPPPWFPRKPMCQC